jgi:Ca2+-binding RTX toxin-like protein
MARTSWPARIGVTLLTTIAVGAVGTPALAATTGTASVSGTKITFKAGSQKNNAVTFTRSGRTITINDRVKIKAGKGCKAVKGDNTKVRCTTKKNPTQITAHLGDRTDTLANKTTLKFYGYGGSGDDKLFGGNGSDRLYGDSGNDRIWGYGGNDSIDAGTGNDIVDAGTGNDRIAAGTGTDKVYGGTGNDRVYGNDGNDQLHGGAGNDHLDGGAGDDKLYGDAGNDRLLGDRGNDKEYGGSGNDTFDQNTRIGDDSDLFVGGTGQDLVTYEKRTENLVLTNDDGIGDDGANSYFFDDIHYSRFSYEKDTISADVENLTGGSGQDLIGGNSDDNVINGGAGKSNELFGGGGDDVIRGAGYLEGGSGRDRLYGAKGYDKLEAGDWLGRDEDKDYLDGGAGDTPGTNACGGSADDVLVNC